MMGNNPYAAPTTECTDGEQIFIHAASVGAAALGGALIGAIAGAAGYVALALLAEMYLVPPPVPGKPFLSYGQAFGFMILVAGFSGAGLGTSIALSVFRKWILSAGTGLLAVALTSVVVVALWWDQIASYGRDPSEYVLYLPFLGLVGIAAAIWLSLRLLALCWRKAHSTAKPKGQMA